MLAILRALAGFAKAVSEKTEEILFWAEHPRLKELDNQLDKLGTSYRNGKDLLIELEKRRSHLLPAVYQEKRVFLQTQNKEILKEYEEVCKQIAAL